MQVGDRTVPDPIRLRQQLQQFRSSCERDQTRYGGADWTYWRAGLNGPPVLWLTGALGVADLAFQHLLDLSLDFRLIAPDYPPVRRLDELSDGLAHIMDREELDQAQVVGGSLGGMVAQHFSRRHSARVKSLVLSHTMGPAPSAVRSITVAAVSKFASEALYRGLFRGRLRRSFTVGGPFWAEYFDATTAELKKVDLVSRVLLASEFLEGRWEETESQPWEGRTVIIDSVGDPLVPPAGTESLLVRYPRASRHTWEGYGHSVAILAPQEYVRVIRRFLERAS